jgi:hypothetical protein
VIGLASASAQSVLLNFGNPAGSTAVTSPYLALDPGHSLGTISASDTSWNWIKTSVVGDTALNYGAGTAASGLSLTVGQGATNATSISYSTPIGNLGLAGSGGAVAGQQNLLGAGSIYGNNTSSTAPGRRAFYGAGNGAAGDPIGLRLDGLSAGIYYVYVMGRNVNSDAASVPMNIFATTGASAGTFNFSSLTPNVEANTGYASATYSGQYTTFQAGENYVSLTLTVNTGDSLFLAIEGSTAAETRGFMNMVEIVPAPEPGTSAMLAMGVLGLLFVIKNRVQSCAERTAAPRP